MNFGTVAILGPGLIGGSLALGLAERGLAERLVIYARSPHALDAIRLAGVDAELTGNPSEAVREADVVILCVPIEAMAGLVSECRDALKPDALVTDVGSVKGSVDAALAPLLRGRALWIGSHPMAGSEQSGFVAARPDLFEDAAVILTPTPDTRPQALARAEQFWKAPWPTSATCRICWRRCWSRTRTRPACHWRAAVFATPRASPEVRRNCGRKSCGPTARRWQNTATPGRNSSRRSSACSAAEMWAQNPNCSNSWKMRRVCARN
jgi:hypothetical protein